MESPDYSHGPLIPLISLFVVFQKRKVLKRIKFDGSSLGIYILLCAILLQAVALRAQVNFLSSYSIILAIVGIVLYLFGKKMLSELLFPILFLFFMVPFWGVITNNLSNLLKILSSFSSFHILQFIGYPVLREGVTLHFAGDSMEVANPCSGIRSLISILAIGTLVVYYSNGTIFKKVILVLLGIPLFFIANTLRIILFGIILETKGILITEGFLHTLTGLAVFIFAFLGLLAFNKWVRM